MSLKIKIKTQIAFVNERWLTARFPEEQDIEAQEILESIPKPYTNISRSKIQGVVQSAGFALDISRRYALAALYLMFAIPGVTILHVGEKILLAINFVFGTFINLLSRFMPTTTKVTPKASAARAPETQIVLYKNPTTSPAVEVSARDASERPVVSHALNLLTLPTVSQLHSTKMVLYRPKILNFSNKHAQINTRKALQSWFKNIDNNRNSGLTNTLKRELSLSSHLKFYTYQSSIQETGHPELDYVSNNENKLVIAGLDLLENERFLTEGNFKGLFKQINLASIVTGITADSEKRLDYLAAILCISWALSAINKRLGNDVVRGSFTIINHVQVYDFFLGYVELVSGSDEHGHFKNRSSLAYSRNPTYKFSSHYTNFTNQYGIDMRFVEQGEAFGLLPHRHSHILFGLIKSNEDTNSTFFKFEPHGIGTPTDLWHHFIDYIYSTKPPKSEISHREKDVPDELQGLYDEFCEQTGEAQVGKLIKEMWQHIIDYAFKNNHNSAQHLSHEADNDWHMVFFDAAKDIKNKFEAIARTYNMDPDNLKHRFGKEAMIKYPDKHEIAETAKNHTMIRLILS